MNDASYAGGDVVAAASDSGWSALELEFEWLQNRAGPWPLEEIHRKLRENMVSAFDAVNDLTTERDIDWRTAAYAVALRRLEDAIQSRGTQTFFRPQQDA